MHALGGVRVGGGLPVRIMGILNASPESFMRSSVSDTPEAISRAAARMEAEGADFIDIGGMSTAPGSAPVSQDEEVRRVVRAIRIAGESCGLPISVDTARSAVARAALDAGAVILNDISGLQHDPEMAGVAGRYRPSLVLCAHSRTPLRGDPVLGASEALRRSVGLAEGAGVPRSSIAVDPAIGFFRRNGGGLFSGVEMDWFRRDVLILRRLREIRRGMPCLVSVSNKSFIGRLMGAPDPADRLAGSLAFEAMAVLMGADIIRTHNVALSREAVGAAQGLRGLAPE